jgi:hypothetical protein
MLYISRGKSYQLVEQGLQITTFADAYLSCASRTSKNSVSVIKPINIANELIKLCVNLTTNYLSASLEVIKSLYVGHRFIASL